MLRSVARRIQRTVVFLLLWSWVGAIWASTPTTDDIVIRHSNKTDIDTEDYYFYRLLELVLLKTDKQWGRARIKELPYRLEDKRLRTGLMQGKVDVILSPTSEVFETQMLPVRVSLLKELNNYRLLLIRKGEQPVFSAVRSLDDLRKLKGGMSSQWTDARIMEHNRLPLAQVVGYGKLFKMLAAKRFDYFSRGLYQIYSEVDLYPELELQIEQELMLSYPNEVYFFVNRNNPELAQRLEEGLAIAQRDGSFEKLFNSIPRYQWGMELLKKHQRRVIELEPLPHKLPATTAN